MRRPSTTSVASSSSSSKSKPTWLLPLTLAALLVAAAGVNAVPSYNEDLRRSSYEPRSRPWAPESTSTQSDVDDAGSPVNIVNGVHVERRPISTSSSINIPLMRRASPQSLHESEYGPWARRQADWLIAKYSGGSNDHTDHPDSDRWKSRRSSGSTYLLNQNTDSTFYASVGIGTPPTAYNLIIDTGSSDMWVAGRSCQEGCTDVPQYDGSNSSTFQASDTQFSVTYGSASAQGVLARDTVRMGGYEAQGQVFAIADSVSTGLLNAPVSGLMGLAFPGIAASQSTPFWMRLASSGSWDKPLMSLVLTRFLGVNGATTLEPGGILTFGALNNSLFTGQIDYVTVPTGTRTYWQLPLKNLTIQGTSITLPSGSDSYAAIDTGTTLIGAPDSIIDQIISLIPNSSSGDGDFSNYIYYPCDSQVTVTFSFGSRVWVIGPNDFELLQVRNGSCVSAFFRLAAEGSTPKWIIGDTFLKNVYSVFQYNPPAVGFANLSNVALAMSTVGDPLPSPSLGATIIITSGGTPTIRLPSSFLSTLSSTSSSILPLTLQLTLPPHLGLDASHGIHSLLLVFIISFLVYSL